MIMPQPSGLDGMKLAFLLADPRRAVTEDAIVCLLCGGMFRQLTNTHLRSHDLTADQYKRRFGYNRRRALMCGALRRVYTERALRTELASRIGWRPIVQQPALRRLGGMRPTTLEERLTRAERRAAVRRAGASPPLSIIEGLGSAGDRPHLARPSLAARLRLAPPCLPPGSIAPATPALERRYSGSESVGVAGAP